MLAVSSRFDRLVAPTLGRHLLLAFGAAVVLFLLSSQIGAYDDYNLTAVAIFAIAAAGLTLLTGLNGQLSLGHVALMAIVAYGASIALKQYHQLPVIAVLVIAVLSSGIIGILFGFAAARLRGPYLAGATADGIRNQPVDSNERQHYAERPKQARKECKQPIMSDPSISQ